MGVFFGTDGLRGVVGEELSFDVAYKCGNALATLTDKPHILIGSDTRVTGDYLTLAVASGAMSGGAFVTDLGVIPTAGVAYLTRILGADYGVVISASHNPKEYNGIKIFGKDGYKLGDEAEERVERCFIREKMNDFSGIGRFTRDTGFVRKYERFLLDAFETRFNGLKIVLDCGYGAAYRIAPTVFKKLGATVIATHCAANGLKINEKSGALHPEVLAKKVTQSGAHLGFAFDGDADRVIAADENGNIVDGDMILYMLANRFKEQGKLRGNAVVGTGHTNMAIERALKKRGVDFIRAEVGDKYVLKQLVERKLSLGGEQSGHIILKDLHTTGDGILTALALTELLSTTCAKIGELFDVKLYPQTNVNVTVLDKWKIRNSETLSKAIVEKQTELKDKGRITVRASGTEPKIRVMVESEDEKTNGRIADELVKIVKDIDKQA